MTHAAFRLTVPKPSQLGSYFALTGTLRDLYPNVIESPGGRLCGKDADGVHDAWSASTLTILVPTPSGFSGRAMRAAAAEIKVLALRHIKAISFGHAVLVHPDGVAEIVK